MLELAPFLKSRLPPTEDLFDRLMDWPGKAFRVHANRKTIRFNLEGRAFYLKVHRGVGWGEIFKSLLNGNLPVTGARNEYNAIKAVREIGISTQTIAGFGERGSNPAAMESFLITEALENMIKLVRLPEKLAPLPAPRQSLLRHALIKEIAKTARKFHAAGFNHRDFYLDHLMVKDRAWAEWGIGDSLDLHLIDLHRMQRRTKPSRRWVVKDVGGLLFSAFPWGLTGKEMALFLRIYSGRPMKVEWRENRAFWKGVLKRARKMYRGHYGEEPPIPEGGY